MKHEGRHFSISGVQVTKRATDIPLMLGGNTEQGPRPGCPPRRRLVLLGHAPVRRVDPPPRRASGAGEAESDRADDPFALVFRMEGADPATARRYEDEGFDEVLMWTDQVWPTGQPARGQAGGDVRRCGVARPVEGLTPAARSNQNTPRRSHARNLRCLPCDRVGDVKLGPRELAVLNALVDSGGRVVDRDQLRRDAGLATSTTAAAIRRSSASVAPSARTRSSPSGGAGGASTPT